MTYTTSIVQQIILLLIFLIKSPLQLVSGKTAKSILISCGARLAPFDIKELRDLMEYDEL